MMARSEALARLRALFGRNVTIKQDKKKGLVKLCKTKSFLGIRHSPWVIGRGASYEDAFANCGNPVPAPVFSGIQPLTPWPVSKSRLSATPVMHPIESSRAVVSDDDTSPIGMMIAESLAGFETSTFDTGPSSDTSTWDGGGGDFSGGGASDSF